MEPCHTIGVRGGGGAGAPPPQFGQKNDLFGKILILFGQLSGVLKSTKGAFECCPNLLGVQIYYVSITFGFFFGCHEKIVKRWEKIIRAEKFFGHILVCPPKNS